MVDQTELEFILEHRFMEYKSLTEKDDIHTGGLEMYLELLEHIAEGTSLHRRVKTAARQYAVKLTQTECAMDALYVANVAWTHPLRIEALTQATAHAAFPSDFLAVLMGCTERPQLLQQTLIAAATQDDHWPNMNKLLEYSSALFQHAEIYPALQKKVLSYLKRHLEKVYKYASSKVYERTLTGMYIDAIQIAHNQNYPKAIIDMCMEKSYKNLTSPQWNQDFSGSAHPTSSHRDWTDLLSLVEQKIIHGRYRRLVPKRVVMLTKRTDDCWEIMNRYKTDTEMYNRASEKYQQLLIQPIVEKAA